MRAPCSVDGCGALADARGMCAKHYQRDRRDRIAGRARPDLDTTRAQAVRVVRGDYDLAERVASYRLRMAAAHARIRQALLVLDNPGVIDADPRDLLSDALEELDPPTEGTP